VECSSDVEVFLDCVVGSNLAVGFDAESCEERFGRSQEHLVDGSGSCVGEDESRLLYLSEVDLVVEVLDVDLQDACVVVDADD
jgi:hypothetical protein